MDVMKPWIAKRITEMLGFEDDIVVELPRRTCHKGPNIQLFLGICVVAKIMVPFWVPYILGAVL